MATGILLFTCLKNVLQQIWQKALFRLDKNWGKIFVGNEIDTVGAFSALQVEKSLLTKKPLYFVKRACCRVRITV